MVLDFASRLQAAAAGAAAGLRATGSDLAGTRVMLLLSGGGGYSMDGLVDVILADNIPMTLVSSCTLRHHST